MAKQDGVSKMVITAYKDGAFQSRVGTYETMINPDKISLNRSIEYNTAQAPDSSNPSMKYKYSPAANLSFDLTLDSTGVVNSNRLDLPKEIQSLQDLVYDYQGDIHRPYFVMLNWGIGQTFKGVLTTFNTNYTLFAPDGVPLRAKISLAFVSYMDAEAVAKEDSDTSPDLTHKVNVVAGDTLPGLSLRIYNKPDYFVQVAQFNKLNKLRHLQPGKPLLFPPLVSEPHPGKNLS